MSDSVANGALASERTSFALLQRSDAIRPIPVRIPVQPTPVPEGSLASPSICIPIEELRDIARARRAGRRLALQLGCSGSRIALVLTAISELARNIIMYARSGEIIMSRSCTAHRDMIVVVANDWGPGIADLSNVLGRGVMAGRSSGLGLSGLEQVMDRFHIDSELGAGTRVTCEVAVG